MKENKLVCKSCGNVIDIDDYEKFNDQILCSDCMEEHTTICDCCGERIWNEDIYISMSIQTFAVTVQIN